MSKLVKDNADFISLLVNTTLIQAQALLDTISGSQVRVISEIAKNLLKLPFEGRAKEELSKNRKLIERLGSSENTLSKKCKIISTHRKKIIHIMRLCRDILMALIGQKVDLNMNSEEQSN